jgi:hypothetical protein
MTAPTPDVDLPDEAVEAAARALFDLAGGDPERWPEAYLKAGWKGMGEAAVAAVLPHLRTQIADEQRKVLDRELDRFNPADNYGEAMEHDLVADIGYKIIAVTHATSSFDEEVAAGDRVVWCQCYGTAEPTGPWIHPDDEHADTCGIDAIRAAARVGLMLPGFTSRATRP